jgi:hypothetical protein
MGKSHLAPKSADDTAPQPLNATEDGRLSRWRFAAGVLLAGVMAAIMSTIAVAAMNSFDYNADAVFLPAFYRDVVSGTSLKYWWLPTVAGFVPDMPLMFGLLLLTGENIALSFVLYAIATSLLLVLATGYLLRGLFRPQWWNWPLIFAVFLLWMLILMAGRDGAFLLSFVLMPSFHSGALILGIFFLACTLRLFRADTPRTMTAAWVVIAAAGAVSDPFFVVQFLGPVLLCLVVFHRRPALPEGLSLVRTALLGTSAVVLAAIATAGARSLFFLGSDFVGNVVLQINDVGPLLKKVYTAFEPLIAHNPAICVLAGLAFLLSVAVLIWLGRSSCSGLPRQKSPQAGGDRHKLMFCLLFFPASAAMTFMFCSLNYSFPLNNPATSRYLQPLYVFPAIILATCLFLLARGNRGTLVAILPAVALGCIVLGILAGDRAMPNRLCAPQPSFVDFFDDLKNNTGASNGLGSYWLSKPTSLLSNSGVHIAPLIFSSGHYAHISNLEWLLVRDPDGRVRLRRYEFLVPYDKFQAVVALARFGPPAGVHEARVAPPHPNGAVFEGPRVRAMMYNRKSDLAFRNYLFIPVLAELGRGLPSHVKTPANLQIFKQEKPHYDDPNCSVIPRDGRLEVVFDPIAKGDVLEISADGNSEYAVEVRRDDGTVENLTAPSMKRPGMLRRFLPLSTLGGVPRVSGLTIRLVSGDGPNSIGHVFIYKDNW